MRPRTSLCLIAKDEEARLPGCLRSAADLVDEIVVVDTGSTDQTRAVAARFGARVVESAWRDDFAAARNESLGHATGDWVFWLDADESLDAENRDRLRAVLAGLGDENAAYLMAQRSRKPSGSATLVDHVRLFRNSPQLRWRYRVHEQILAAVEESGAELRPTDVVIDHTGYADADVGRGKLERNLRLLRQEAAERSDDPFVLFNLGMTYHGLGQFAQALPALERSLALARPGRVFLRKLHLLLAQGRARLGRREAALADCRAGLAQFPDDVELLFQEALLHRERGDLAAAESSLLRSLSARPGTCFTSLDLGLQQYLTRHTLAQVYRQQGREAEAEAQWHAVVTSQPDFLPAWAWLGEMWLSQGRWHEAGEALRRLEAAPAGAQDAAKLRAIWHMTRGEVGAARELLEGVIARDPQALGPRLLLGRLLLREGRDPAAAERTLREVLAMDPDNAEARRLLDGGSRSAPDNS